MRRALRQPRWLAGLAVAVVFALVCVWLAQWQLDRRVQRAERNAAVLANYDAAPTDLRGLADVAAAGVEPEEEWVPARVSGRYRPEDTVLVRNRPQERANGYLVAVPFDVSAPDDGLPRGLLVVRGWVPSGSDAARPESVPAPPPGEVGLVVRLRATESPATRGAPPGQTYRLDVPALLPGRGSLTEGYGVLATEDGAPPAGLRTVPRPDVDPGPHLAYGVQWYLFAVAGLAIWVVLARRAGRDEEQETAGAPAGDWVYEPGR
ncbi:SURF1 family cytochrome oxidase biogenesis protein [Aquipuribacter sp. SD81]|uniref:SURF1 family cytochrome oxidase biogenesis protein n=1 Tax=Aquipuribacter sp. SD81 TaxID=3127703 RepID=UPI003019F83B